MWALKKRKRQRCRAVYGNEERETKRMEEDGEENDQTSRRGGERPTPLDTVKPRRKGEEETEAGLDGNGGRKGERGRVGLIGGGVNWES